MYGVEVGSNGNRLFLANLAFSKNKEDRKWKKLVNAFISINTIDI